MKMSSAQYFIKLIKIYKIFQMALRNRGLRYGDDDDYKPQDYGRTDFEADRKKTNFEKNMDDLLFGNGPAPPRRGRPTQETKPNNQSNNQPGSNISKPGQSMNLGIESKPSKKQIEKPKLDDSKGSYSGRNKFDDSRGSNQGKKADDSREFVKPKKQPKQYQSGGRGPKEPQKYQPEPEKKEDKWKKSPEKKEEKKKPKINNYVEEESGQQIHHEKKQEVLEQPERHVPDEIPPQQAADIDKMRSFNRPGYIRKLKKVAEDFKFSTENATRHAAIDVVRPVQCVRDMMKRLNSPDFVDIQFPPESASVGFQHRSEWILFKKPHQLFKSPVFGKYIDPNDISPGSMSSPQFLSTLSCLAERQNNIKRLIEDQKINSNGFYYVRLNINGVWRYVVVDDGLPESEEIAIGARSFGDSESDIWASIVEKAYAKAYSGYNVFKRNVARENYLRDLTGAPVRSYRTTDHHVVGAVNEALAKGYPVIAVPTNKIVDLGLNPNYSFSVLKCSGKGALELRNSWGTVKERPNVSLSREGVFELSSAYAHDYISHIMIAHTDSDLCTTTIQSKHHNSFYSAYNFTVNNDTRGFISISQLDERLFSAKKSYQYSPMRVIIVKKTEEGESVYVNAGFSHHSKNLDMEVNLTTGNYHIYCIGQWVDQIYDYYITISCYQNVDLRKVYFHNFPNIIAESLTKQNIDHGKRSSKGHVDEYILYHEPSNLVLQTAVNLLDKPYKHTQNMGQVKMNSLTLINALHPEDNYTKKTREELERYKEEWKEKKTWEVNLLANEQFTWVISNGEEYDPSNFKKWGFK